MNSKLLNSFNEYIASSISKLRTSLTETLINEVSHYDGLYKEFVKIIDAFKMDILNQIKPQLFPEYLVTANKNQEAQSLLNRLQGLVNSQKVENPERQSIENNDHASLKLNKNTESNARPFREIESNLLLSNIDISNKDLLAQRPKHNDDLQKNIIKDSFIRPAPKLSAYRSDDVALSKHNAVSNGSGEKNRFSLDRLARGTGTPDKFDSNPKAIENNESYSSLTRSSTFQEQNEAQSQAQHTRSKTDSFFRVFGAPCSNNGVKINFGERYRQTFLNKQSNESTLENPTPEIVQTERTNESELQGNYQSTNRESKPQIESDVQDQRKVLNKEISQRNELAHQKLKGIFVKRYFHKWRHLISVFHIEKYDDNDFDLLHGNIEGIEDISGLDISTRIASTGTEDPRLSKKGILASLKLKDVMISSEYENENLLSGRLSFCDINFPETDRSCLGDKILFPDQKTLMELKKEFQPQLVRHHESPPRKPLASRQHFPHISEKENMKHNNKDKAANVAKKASHLTNSHKKENQRPEYIRTAARTSLQKSPAGPVKAIAPARGGSLISNKENAFTGKTSPVRPLRKLSGNFQL